MLESAGFVVCASFDLSCIAGCFDDSVKVSELESFAKNHPQTPIILVTAGLERGALATCVELPTLLAVVSPERPEEIVEALATRTGESRPLLNRWMSSSSFSREVGSSVEREAFLEEVERYLRDLNVRGRLVHVARDAIEELVTNALYDAPADSTGRRIYVETDRRNAIFLPPSARPRLDLAVEDSRVIAIMTDPHGSLELLTARRFLGMGLRGRVSDKPGGAGLGFARVFGLVDRLAIEIAPRTRTQIGFVLEAGRRDISQTARLTSLLLCEV